MPNKMKKQSDNIVLKQIEEMKWDYCVEIK